MGKIINLLIVMLSRSNKEFSMHRAKHLVSREKNWIPAFAGMTRVGETRFFVLQRKDQNDNNIKGCKNEQK
jgi:hypothetical protein